MYRRLRQIIGVILFDWRRYSKAFKSLNSGWLYLCNRNEKFLIAPDGINVACDWKWTSELHAPKLFPSLGKRLFQRVVYDFPFCINSSQQMSTQAHVHP